MSLHKPSCRLVIYGWWSPTSFEDVSTFDLQCFEFSGASGPVTRGVLLGGRSGVIEQGVLGLVDVCDLEMLVGRQVLDAVVPRSEGGGVPVRVLHVTRDECHVVQPGVAHALLLVELTHEEGAALDLQHLDGPLLLEVQLVQLVAQTGFLVLVVVKQSLKVWRSEVHMKLSEGAYAQNSQLGNSQAELNAR